MSEFIAAEIQGPYGPLTIPEQVLQQIWLEKKYVGDALTTVSGKNLEVEFPGLWNHQEGPDFLNARLKLDGEPLLGDVEIHFYDKDWENHGHHQDTEFNRVVLHVVLFPTKKPPITTQSGNTVETLVFLPYLETDLEQYVLDYRLTRLEQTGELPLVDLLAPLDSEHFLDHFYDASMVRWKAKVEAHAHRLADTTWEDACHQILLESLGGRRNRAVFAKIALTYPLSEWKGGGFSVEELYAQFDGEWRLAGLRPAAHPQARLKQYLDLVKQQSKWPEKLLGIQLQTMYDAAPSRTSLFRRQFELKNLLISLKENIFINQLSESMISTLVADMILPLLETKLTKPLFPYWYHWFPGNFPQHLAKFLRDQLAERGIKVPLSNGLQQGLLKMIDELRQ
jgi:hypothetical protein